MDAIEHLLLNYDALTPAERAEAEAYLAAHPEAHALVTEGRALYAVLEQAARSGGEVPDPESVARYVLSRYASRHPLPPDLAAIGRRVEAALRTHPEVERQYSIMQDRLRALADGAEAPRSQFERLAGYSLDSVPAVDPTPVGAASTESAAPAFAPDRHRSWRAPSGAPDPRPLLRRLSLPRLAMAASFLLALAYVGLLLASNATRTEFEQLADLESVPSEYEGLRLRGVDGLMDPAAERYAAALDRLNEARSTTLGLFPHYDEAGLDTTLHLLQQVTTLDGPDAALGLEAWYLIGRILLHQGNTDAARAAFQIVVERQGPSTPDARRMLHALSTERVVSMAMPGPVA